MTAQGYFVGPEFIEINGIKYIAEPDYLEELHIVEQRVRSEYISKVAAVSKTATQLGYDEGYVDGIKKENQRISKALHKGADSVPFWIWGVIDES